MAQVRKKRVVIAALIVVVGNVLATASQFINTWVTGQPIDYRLLVASVVMVALTSLLAFIGGRVEQSADRPPAITVEGEPSPAPTSQPGSPPVASQPHRTALYRPQGTVAGRSSGTVSLVAAMALVLGLCGGGVGLATIGVGYAIDKFATFASELPGPGGADPGKDEKGVERLVRAASASQKQLTITVDKVTAFDSSTRVEMAMKNTGEVTLHLPVFETCQLVIADGTTLKADPARSSLPDATPGETVRGTVVFTGTLPAAATTATLAFSTVHGSSDIQSIRVTGIALNAGRT